MIGPETHGEPLILAVQTETESGKPVVLVYKNDVQELGRLLVRGAAWWAWKWWVWFVVCGVLVSLALTTCARVDATDATRWDRSDLRPRTDHGTGCQYLESSAGALTPRLDAAGRPICGGRS